VRITMLKKKNTRSKVRTAGSLSCMIYYWNKKMLVAVFTLVIVGNTYLYVYSGRRSITSIELNNWNSTSTADAGATRGVSAANTADSIDPAIVSTTPTSSKTLMIIAAYPSDDIKLPAIWSQLECFANKDIDKIIIAAPIGFEQKIGKFVEQVKLNLPDVGLRLEAHYYTNDRYDYGLWCDSLTTGAILKMSKLGAFLGGSSEYNQFLLLNDSIMAVEHTNEFLVALESKNASLVSLNYWGDKDSKKSEDQYWVESPIRAFSLEGMQMYADNICPLQKIHWRTHCRHYAQTMIRHRGVRNKRCIVEKTEIGVAQLYASDKVHGLYKGSDSNGISWTRYGGSEYWTDILRDQMSFPAMKVSHGNFELYREKRPQDIARCTVHLEKE
jgi:hypothetical protein